MFKRKTVFIVGAGASAEYGLPPGKVLASTISNKMDIRFERGNRSIGKGDMDIYLELTRQMQDHSQEYQAAAWLIRDGIHLARSIDDFLDLHQSNPFIVEYGKAAIVKSVLEAEHKSNLYFGGTSGRDDFHPGGLANTWLVKFVQMLGPGIPVNNVRDVLDNVSFIVFNYDRCIEFFLRNALQKLYGISERDAGVILDDLDIIHPYGLIDKSVPFGSVRANYQRLAEGIKTYTEQVGDADVIAALADKVYRADCIVFLGFAYHDQNMELLAPHKEKGFPGQVFGTAYGMSDADVGVVRGQIDQWFVGHQATHYGTVHIENNLKCADLFDHYAKSLSGAAKIN